ncbi:MAG: antibiotic biosynthesis monooxygenase [Acidobacteria bacterium]|nr:MAG: antibiotic biosynthesis monooxygenase [Acidobacteriota bacterium]
MLILVVRVTITAGHEQEVAESFRQLQEETRREPGCIAYVVQRSRENPRVYMIYEQYKDQAALEAHRNSPHFKQYATNGFYRFVEERRAEFFDPI